MNSDISQLSNHPAFPSTIAADSEIQFCLAQRSPTGAATTVITRTYTTTSSWSTNNRVKNPSFGGVAPWNASQYLNIWVCVLSNGVLGYAQFPGGSASTDGVVIDYRYFGTTGTATAPYNKGRTATHEVGHYLNLRHIWGDATCGSDLVNDTPVHNAANYGCPAVNHKSTCTRTPVEMTMNYMDYTDDACMYMLTNDQKTRMRAVLAAGGARVSLLTSQGCAPPTPGSCSTPSGLATSNIGTTTATASWTAVSGATYVFEIKAASATTWTTTSVTGTSVSISGLTPSTLYNTRVKAVCTGGESGYSIQVDFTTLGTSTCTDVYESNNSRSAAKSITPGSLISAAISTSTDNDYFKFSNTSALRNMRLTLSNLPLDYDLQLFRSNTLQITSAQTGLVNETIIYNGGSLTTYYARVYPKSSTNFSASSCYNLLVELSGTSYTNGTGESGNSDNEAEIILPERINEEFLIFPNPASDEISVILPFTELESEGYLHIFDISGRELYNHMIQGSSESNSIQMNISEYKPGMYFFKFVSNGKIYVQRLMVTGL